MRPLHLKHLYCGSKYIPIAKFAC